MLIGDNLILHPLEEEDLSIITKWRNQVEIRRSFFTSSLLPASAQKRWFEVYLSDASKEIFIAELKEESKKIGMIGLYHIDHKNHKAEIGSTIVGDTKMWGKGFGREIIKITLDYGFKDLHLNRIYAYALKTNYGSIKSKEGCGFKIEGIVRQDYYDQGSFKDVVLLSILREDWL